MAKRTLLILVLSFVASMLPTFALDEDADFVGYMENLEKLEQERERINKMLQDHEEWRQNTWGGFAVRQVQAIGHHFEPFFLAVGDAMRDGGRSGPTQYAILIVLRIVVISMCVTAVYAIGRIISMITGQVIVVEETVVVDDSAADGRGKREKRRGAREKKKES